jgi:hypothetical protein
MAMYVSQTAVNVTHKKGPDISILPFLLSMPTAL